MDSKVLTLIALLAMATMIPTPNGDQNEFAEFKSNYGKVYSDIEESVRMAIYLANVAEINAHNADSTQTYKMAVNQFTDLTADEFRTTMLMPTRPTPNRERDDYSPIEATDVNWVTQGAVQKVKDQGSCGSCWAFSAAASSESYKWYSTGSLGDFSEQELVSCDTGTNQGCSGGWEHLGMRYYASNGICTESSYPYTSGNGGSSSCKLSKCTKDSFKYTGSKQISGSSTIKNINNQRPISVAVDASKWSSYSSGIFSNCNKNINHAVLLAGYTSSYWLIKNSWGKSWGESGYIRLKSGNTCGVTDDASYPTGA